jgi:hypothetical protein
LQYESSSAFVRGKHRRLVLYLLGIGCAEPGAFLKTNLSLEVQMKRIAAVAIVLGLAAAPAAFAEPVKMSDSQLDQVAAGLADVSISLTNVGNPTVTVNPSVQANPSVSVSVL